MGFARIAETPAETQEMRVVVQHKVQDLLYLTWLGRRLQIATDAIAARGVSRMDDASLFRVSRDLRAIKIAILRTKAELGARVLELERSRDLLTRANELLDVVELELAARQAVPS